jgi:hypothetical protein
MGRISCVGHGVSINSINCNKLIVFNPIFFLPFCDLKIIIRIPQIYKEKRRKGEYRIININRAEPEEFDFVGLSPS